MESSIGPSMSSIGPSIASQAFMANRHRNEDNADLSGDGDSAVHEREEGLENIMENLNDEDDHSAFQASDDSDDSNVNSSTFSSKLRKQKPQMNFGSNVFSSAATQSSVAYPKYGDASHSNVYSSQAGLKSNQDINEHTDSNTHPTHSGDYYQHVISKPTSGTASKSSESNERQQIRFNSSYESSLHLNSGSMFDHHGSAGNYIDSKSGVTFRDSNMISNSNLENVTDTAINHSNTFPKTYNPSKIPHSDNNQFKNKHALNGDKHITTIEEDPELWNEFSKQRQEILELKKALEEVRDNSKRELRILQSQATTLQTENERLKAFIQQKDRVLSAMEQEKTSLKGNLVAVDLEVKAERNAKEEVIKKLEYAEVTIKSLDVKLAELARSEKRTRYKEQHEKIVNDLKQRHADEVLNLKNDIKELQVNLESKVSKIDTLQQHLDEIMQKCENLSANKPEVYGLNSDIGDSQSVTNTAGANEVTRLKRKVIELEIKQKDLERENVYLKKMGDCVKSEIEGRHSIGSLQIRLEALDEEWRTRNHEEPPSVPRSVEKVEAEMQRTFQVLAAQKALNERLSNQLQTINSERDKLLARSKFFEQKWDEENKKYLDIEDKWLQAVPAGAIPVSQHDKQIQALQMGKVELEAQLKDVQMRLKEVSDNEAHLNELLRQQRVQMLAIVKQHDEDKKNAIDIYAKVQVEEREKLSKTYEKQISQLKKQVKQFRNRATLHNGRFDEKEASEEIFDLSKDAVQEEYKEQLNEQAESKTKLETRLRKELEIEKEKWETEKKQEVTAFIMEMKQKLVAEYDDYLAQEKKKILQKAEEEKQRIIEMYDKKLDKSNKEEKELNQKEEMEKMIHFYEKKCEQAKKTALEELTIAHRKEIEIINQTCSANLDKLKKENSLEYQEKSNLISKYRELYKQEVETSTEKISKVRETLSAEYQKALKLAESEIAELKEKIEKLIQEKMSLSKALQSVKSAEGDKKQKQDETENTLKNALKTANETIVQLQSKKEKYVTYSAKLKMELKEIKQKLKSRENVLVQKEISLKKSDLINKELSYKLQFPCKETAIGICQTEEAMVPKQKVFAVRDNYIRMIACLFGELKSHMKVSRNRVSNSLQQCMKAYQDSRRSAISCENNEFDNVLHEIETLLHKLQIPHQTIETAEIHSNEESEHSNRKVINSARKCEENMNIPLQFFDNVKIDAGLIDLVNVGKSPLTHSTPLLNRLSYNPLSTNQKKITQPRVSRQHRSRDFHNKKGIETQKPSEISSCSPAPEGVAHAHRKPRRSRSVEATSCSAQQPQSETKRKSKHVKLSKIEPGNDSSLSPKESVTDPDDSPRSTIYRMPNDPLIDLSNSVYRFLNQLQQIKQLKS